MAEDMKNSPVVIKLYSKPEVPQVVIDINELPDGEDNCGVETKNSLNDFEADNDLRVRKGKRIYVKKVKKKYQRRTVMEQTEATGMNRSCRCASRTPEPKLVSPRKITLSAKQVIKEPGSSQKSRTSKKTLVKRVSIGIQCDSSELEPVTINATQSPPIKYARKLFVLHNDSFDLPYVTPKKPSVSKYYKALKRASASSRGTESQKKDKIRNEEFSPNTKMGEMPEMTKESDSFVGFNEKKGFNMDRFLNSERTMNKSSYILSSSLKSCRTTPSQPFLSHELQPELLPSIVVEDMEDQDFTLEIATSLQGAAEPDYDFPSAASAKLENLPSCKIITLMNNSPSQDSFDDNVSQECQSPASTSRTSSSQGSEGLTFSETEAAQIMLQLFYSGNITSVEKNELHKSDTGDLGSETQSIVLGDGNESPEEQAKTIETVIAESNVSCNSFLNQERVKDIHPSKGTEVTESISRNTTPNNQEIIGTQNIDSPPKARRRGRPPKNRSKLAQAQGFNEIVHDKRITLTRGQQKMLRSQRSYKCRVTNGTTSSQILKNSVAKKFGNKFQAGMPASVRRSKRFQGLSGALSKSTKKLEESQVLKIKRKPGRRPCRAYQIMDKPKHSENKENNIQEFEFTEDFNERNDQSCNSEDMPVIESRDSNVESTSAFKDKIEVNNRSGKKDGMEVCFADGFSYPFEQNMLFNALGLVERHSPSICKPHDVSSSHIAHRTRNVTSNFKRMRECQVVLEDCDEVMKNKMCLEHDIPKCDQVEKRKSSPVKETQTSYAHLFSPVLDFNFEGFLSTDIDISDDFCMSDLEFGEELRYSTDNPGSLVQTAKRKDGNCETHDSVPHNINIQELTKIQNEVVDANMLHSEADSQQVVSEKETEINELKKGDISQKRANECNPEEISEPTLLISHTRETSSTNDNSLPGLNKDPIKRRRFTTNKHDVIKNKCLICGKSCFTKAKLKRHCAKHHENKNQLMVQAEISCDSSSLSEISGKECYEVETPRLILHSPELITASEQGENSEDLTRCESWKKSDDDVTDINLDPKGKKDFCSQHVHTEKITKENARTDNLNSVSDISICKTIHTDMNPLKEQTLVTEDHSLIEPLVTNSRKEIVRGSDSKLRTLTSEMTNDNAEFLTPKKLPKRKLRNTVKDNQSLNKHLRVLPQHINNKEETILKGKEDVKLKIICIRFVTVMKQPGERAIVFNQKASKRKSK
ncbi:uncharacterized protein LOC125036331 [Penaeus chinensis]|uniref:uncharacterized protein LOC125036331 n=1 Tax=Penaeus chinensis TaxID=139456 RepID=UPI001FB7B0F0|nr:uncharacterized protein LOC125036331 [Penaeus chinensis]